MKNKLFKKIFVSLVLIAMFGVISAGCGTTAPPIIITPPPAQTCTVIVWSNSAVVWGQAVYMNGNPVPSSLLLPWGSVQINNVSVGVYTTIQIINGNTFSHSEYLTTVPGVNNVHFYQW